MPHGRNRTARRGGAADRESAGGALPQSAHLIELRCEPGRVRGYREELARLRLLIDRIPAAPIQKIDFARALSRVSHDLGFYNTTEALLKIARGIELGTDRGT